MDAELRAAVLKVAHNEDVGYWLMAIRAIGDPYKTVQPLMQLGAKFMRLAEEAEKEEIG